MLECSYWNFSGARVVIKIPVQKIEKVIYEEKNRRIRLCGALFDEQWKDDRLIVSISGKCARCDTVNVWKNVNIFGEGGGAEPFICHKCGQSHSNTFQDVYLRYAYKNLLNICDNYEHVVLWGQGRKLVALFEIYQKKLDCSIYYVDNSPSKKGKDFFGLMIHSPKEMLDYSADFVILAVGDKNMNVIKSKVKYILEKQGRQFVRIVTLGEIMNPNFEV